MVTPGNGHYQTSLYSFKLDHLSPTQNHIYTVHAGDCTLQDYLQQKLLEETSP